eukprot:jgi/Chlat1/8608/Chrsp86S00657
MGGTADATRNNLSAVVACVARAVAGDAVTCGGGLGMAACVAGMVLGLGDLALKAHAAHKRGDTAEEKYQLLDERLQAVRTEFVEGVVSLQTFLDQQPSEDEVRKDANNRLEELQRSAQDTAADDKMWQLQQSINSVCHQFVEFLQASEALRKRMAGAMLMESQKVAAHALQHASTLQYPDGLPFVMMRVTVTVMQAATLELCGTAKECKDKLERAIDMIKCEASAIQQVLMADAYISMHHHWAVLAWLFALGRHLTEFHRGERPDASPSPKRSGSLEELLGQQPTTAGERLTSCDAAAQRVHAMFDWIPVPDLEGPDALIAQMVRLLSHGSPSAVAMAAAGLEALALNPHGMEVLALAGESVLQPLQSYIVKSGQPADCHASVACCLMKMGSWRCSLEWKGLQDWVQSVAWSPDGQTLATADSLTAALWNAATGERMHQFTLDDLYVQSVRYSPDGSRLAIGAMKDEDEDDTKSFAIHIMDVASRKNVHHVASKGHGWRGVQTEAR